MSLYSLAELGLTQLPEAPAQVNALVDETAARRPFGWSLQAALQCLVADYGVQPRRLNRSLQIAIAKQYPPMTREPETHIAIALADPTGSRLLNLDWTGSKCTHLATDVIKRYWGNHHKKQARDWQQVPAEIADMHQDTFGTRLSPDISSWSQLYAHAMMARLLNPDAIAMAGESPLAPQLKAQVTKIERLRHYLQQGRDTHEGLYLWPIMQALGTTAQLWESLSFQRFWDAPETVTGRPRTTSASTDLEPGSPQPTWIRLANELRLIGANKFPNRPAADYLKNELMERLWNIWQRWPYAKFRELRDRYTDDLLADMQFVISELRCFPSWQSTTEHPNGTNAKATGIDYWVESKVTTN